MGAVSFANTMQTIHARKSINVFANQTIVFLCENILGIFLGLLFSRNFPHDPPFEKLKNICSKAAKKCEKELPGDAGWSIPCCHQQLGWSSQPGQPSAVMAPSPFLASLSCCHCFSFNFKFLIKISVSHMLFDFTAFSFL